MKKSDVPKRFQPFGDAWYVHGVKPLQTRPNCSPGCSRAPLANSEALICLRPSSLTDCKRKNVALPQETNQPIFAPMRVPGALLAAAKVVLERSSLRRSEVSDTGLAQMRQVCPRKVVLAQGQRAKPRTRLSIACSE